MDIKQIQYHVGKQMRDFPEFRLHKNREKLWLKIRNEFGKEIKFSSVERAQRKLWEKGLYIPEDPKDLTEWISIRRKRTNEMINYAKT